MCRFGTTFFRVLIILFSIVACTHSKEELGNLGITLERNYQEAAALLFSFLSGIRTFSPSAEFASVSREENMPIHVLNFPLCKFYFGLITGVLSRKSKQSCELCWVCVLFLDMVKLAVCPHYMQDISLMDLLL